MRATTDYVEDNPYLDSRSRALQEDIVKYAATGASFTIGSIHAKLGGEARCNKDLVRTCVHRLDLAKIIQRIGYQRNAGIWASRPLA